MRLKKETTMVLAVDYQEKLMPAMHNKDAFIPRTCLLLKGLKALDIPMIASEHVSEGIGLDSAGNQGSAGHRAVSAKDHIQLHG